MIWYATVEAGDDLVCDGAATEPCANERYPDRVALTDACR